MVCDSKFLNVQPAVRKTQIEEALKRLEDALAKGQASLVIGPQGAVAIKGWDGASRNGVMDSCALRKLLAKGSFPLRQAIARAEMQQGRKVNEREIAAGTHLHGDTWHKGH